MKVVTAGIFFLVACLVGSFVYIIVCDEERSDKLKQRIEALEDGQRGCDLHLQFVDSDHAKLGKDIGNLRADVDYMRYREGR